MSDGAVSLGRDVAEGRQRPPARLPRANAVIRSGASEIHSVQVCVEWAAGNANLDVVVKWAAGARVRR
jgi:hypothetical protein